MAKVAFSVDAGIINRLGLELVAKSETALAELIKNAYDADANVVSLYFENADSEGGSLTIEDDGAGMDKTQLIKGFMRLATTDKLHNSISKQYNRPKAGRKGIGRFSTQRLGKRLEIITQAENKKTAHKLVINWDDYRTDKEISQVTNELNVVIKGRPKGEGTTLLISDLREKWSDADIRRVYRYVAELIQPDLLKVGAGGTVVTEAKKEGFEVRFFRRNLPTEDWAIVADPQVMLLDRALATFSGYIDSKGYGHCKVESKGFTFEGRKKRLSDELDMDSPLGKLLTKSQIAFKAYYFIGGDRTIYYGITRSELGVISDYLEKNGGIKLYRNGFRVPKYGDQENDWLSIEKNSRIGKGIPFSNKNLVGFVQLTDPKGEVFEESAGREGLIEKEAFTQLQQFISKALQDAFLRFISWFRKSDEYKASNPDKKPAPTASSVKKNVANLKDAAETLRNPDATEEQKAEASIKLEVATKIFISASNAAISELEMMRVLAGTGLTIAEFIHEVKQIVPSTKNYIEDTLAKKPDTEISENLRNIKSILSSLEAYTSYFDETISKNVLRDLQPIDLRIAVKSFMEVTAWDFRRRKIDIQLGLTGKDLISTPMHPSEWNTILQNLYSNAKKAIIKAGVGRGRILISARKDISSGNIIFEFQDNGSGIKEKDKSRIFDAFFTTATNRNDELGTGTGLGLHILQQMIVNRGGAITVELPEAGFKTNIRITLPLANTTELKKYGY